MKKVYQLLRSSGSRALDEKRQNELCEGAKKLGWDTIAQQIDYDFFPLFLDSGVCPFYELMKQCECDILHVIGAEHLSINPKQLLRIEKLLTHEKMEVYLEIQHQYLSAFVQAFQLFEE